MGIHCEYIKPTPLPTVDFARKKKRIGVATDALS